MNETETSVHDILSGRQPISLSLHIAGGIIIGIVILTCCCTLIVKHKCARIVDKITGRKKKEKYPPSKIEEGRGRKRLKKLRAKRRRTISPEELIQDQAEITAPIVPREPERSENGSPTPCHKCFRKKKKRRAKRQIR